jgi:hypothetical protein
MSEFSGIVIYMYARDHEPPHGHAIYAGDEATVSIEKADLLEGSLPSRARALIREWAAKNRGALEQDWKLARDGRSLNSVPPLD